MEFELEQNLKAASIDATHEGYVCYLGQEYDNYPVSACITKVPTKQFLEKAIDFFTVLSERHSGKFEYYDFETESYFEELDHWVLFEDTEPST